MLQAMNWQQIVSLTIVALAAGMLLRGQFRRRKFSFARDTACGCTAHSGPAEKSSICFRARKDGHRAVVVKIK